MFRELLDDFEKQAQELSPEEFSDYSTILYEKIASDASIKEVLNSLAFPAAGTGVGLALKNAIDYDIKQGYITDKQKAELLKHVSKAAIPTGLALGILGSIYRANRNTDKEVLAKDLTAQDRKELPEEVFGLPEKRKFPMPDKAHVSLAWRYVDKSNITDAEKAEVRKRVLSRAKELGMDTSEWKTAEESNALDKVALFDWFRHKNDEEIDIRPQEDPYDFDISDSPYDNYFTQVSYVPKDAMITFKFKNSNVSSELASALTSEFLHQHPQANKAVLDGEYDIFIPLRDNTNGDAILIGGYANKTREERARRFKGQSKQAAEDQPILNQGYLDRIVSDETKAGAKRGALAGAAGGAVLPAVAAAIDRTPKSLLRYSPAALAFAAAGAGRGAYTGHQIGNHVVDQLLYEVSTN